VIDANSTSTDLGTLLSQYSQLVNYSSITYPAETTFYQVETATVSAYYSAFDNFDVAIGQGEYSSYSIPNGGTQGYIDSPAGTLEIYGSFSSAGSTVTKLSLDLGNGTVIVANGSFHYSGLPYISPLQIGSELESVTSSTPDPINTRNVVIGSVTAQAYYNGSIYSGSLLGFADGYFDAADQKYLTINVATSGQFFEFGNGTDSVSDGTVEAIDEHVLNESATVTDTIAVSGLNLDVKSVPRTNFASSVVAGNDTISLAGNGVFDILPGLANSDGMMTSATIKASAAIVMRDLAALQSISQQGKLGAVELTDVGVPTLSITSGEQSADAAALARIVTPHNTAVVESLPCYAAGTRIATARGPVAVEHLRIEDRVILADGDRAPIVWLGHRRVDCRRHPRPSDVHPIRIAANAFGVGRPLCDVLLSPDHAVFVDGVLIPVRHLLNDATIRQEDVASVTYWHVELPRHGVLLAEGLPAESYLDTGNRASFVDCGKVTRAHPTFARSVWQRQGCAPLVTEGPVRDIVYRRLLVQALTLGWEIEMAKDRDPTWLRRSAKAQPSRQRAKT
jgi:hypothetical protein